MMLEQAHHYKERLFEAIIRLRRNLGACKLFAGAKMHMHNYTIINYGIITSHMGL